MPAFRRRKYVACGHREIDHRFGVVAAFLLVGIQQRITGFTLNHQRQFPRQIEDIAHATVVPLPLPDRHNVRRIARQQHAINAKTFGQTCVMGINALADQLDVVRVRQYFAQKLAHILRFAELRFGFPRHHHKFKATHRVRQRSGDIRAHRIAAQVHMRCAERIVGDIHHNPLIRRGFAFKWHIQRTSDVAGPTVAGHQPLSFHRFTLAIRRFQVQRHFTILLAEGFQFAGEQAAHVGKTRQPFQHHRVYLRLNKRVAARPAKFVGHRLDISKTAPFRGEKAHRMPRRGVRQNIFDQTDGLHGAQRFIVNADGARIVDKGIELLHHQHLNAHLAKIVRHHQPDRTGTGNRYLHGVLHSGLDIWIYCCHFRTSLLGQNAIADPGEAQLFFC